METIAAENPTSATYPSSFYKNLIDSLHEGVLLLHGFYGKVITGNKKACEILEISEEDMTGHEILKMNWQAIHKNGTAYKIFDFPASITLHTGKPQQNVIMGIITNSRTKWISVSSFPFEGEKKGLPDCVVVSFFDITDMKIAEKKAKE